MSQDDQIRLVTERLDRFEKTVTSKLDILTDALVKLARTEEKLISIEKDRANQHERTNRLSQKIDDLNSQVLENSSTVRSINRIFWAVLLALITSGVGITLTTIFL